MSEQITALSFFATVMWVLAGILVSLVLPFAIRVLKNDSGLESTKKRPSIWKRIATIWAQYNGNKYLMKVLAAFIVAVGLVFLLDLKFYTLRDAVLAGFAWESLVDKLSGQQYKKQE